MENLIITTIRTTLVALGDTPVDVAGAEQSDDGRETPRSPTFTSSHTERSSTSSDSVVCTNTDHTVNDRHSADEITSRVLLPKGKTECNSF